MEDVTNTVGPPYRPSARVLKDEDFSTGAAASPRGLTQRPYACASLVRGDGSSSKPSEGSDWSNVCRESTGLENLC